jgi:diguanylate cyclase
LPEKKVQLEFIDVAECNVMKGGCFMEGVSIMQLVIFTGGFAAGLLAFSAVYVIKSKVLHTVLDAIGSVVLFPVTLLLRCFRKRSGATNLLESAEVLRPVVDEREQRLNDTAQTIRGILLSLATEIQRTEKAANDSTEMLGDVRDTIDRMELPADLKEAHAILMKEIDRVMASNATLKDELASSKEVLEFQRCQIETLRTAVRIDSLTQLANRAYFDEKLTEMLKLRQRYDDEPFALMMIDLDNFKTINDSYGHPAGDRILKGVATKIKATLRGSDFIARFGGDEFALILVKTEGKSAEDVAWKICSEVRGSRFLLDSETINMTISIGLAEAHKSDTEESLLKRADQALYRVKEQGRNSVCVAENV